MTEPAVWTELQREQGAFYDRYWRDLYQAGSIDPVVLPDEELFREDLGRSLSYMLDRMGDLSGAKVIDLGCGPGDCTVFVARHGAHVSAIDVARSALEITQQRAAASGVAERVHTHLMRAEQLDFPDGAFDYVFGFGVLHHADLAVLGPEIRRVLKPEGKALFREPLGTNPLLEFGRRHLPYRGKYRSYGERPLTYEDIALVGQSFSATHVRELYLFSGISRLLGSESSRLFSILWTLDEYLLSHFPSLRSWCRYAVIEYER